MSESEALREHGHLRPGPHIDEHIFMKITKTPEKARLVIANRREDRRSGGQAGRIGNPLAERPDGLVRFADFRKEFQRQFESPDRVRIPTPRLYVEHPAAPAARRLGDRSTTRQLTAEKLHDEGRRGPPSATGRFL